MKTLILVSLFLFCNPQKETAKLVVEHKNWNCRVYQVEGRSVIVCDK